MVQALPQGVLPEDVDVSMVEKNTVAEVNNVYRCEGNRSGRGISFYLKVSRNNNNRNMRNECDALSRVREHGIPVPRVLWYGRGTREYMALEEVQGTVLRDLLNPNRPAYAPHLTSRFLRKYGEALAQIHSLPLDWQPQKRANFYDLIGEQEIPDVRYQDLTIWLEANQAPPKDLCFVHGDLNTANIILERGEVAGILDWEYAGVGWREYDLAWILRAERGYLNSKEDRKWILDGYAGVASFDRDALRWCEVMNYLHVAFLSRHRMPGYEEFYLEKARAASFDGFE